MDKVKESIKHFTAKAGHNDTTVQETVAPAVTHEVIKPREHEEVNTVVDKEVHQDHYHQTIQPVQDREVLPEQHTANIGPTVHREFDQRDNKGIEAALAADQARIKNERVVDATAHTQSTAPTVGGEHIHHHVHETIQPVVEKETIQPTVIHTTVPVHETHHKAAKHHTASELPPVTMDEFKAKGGVLGGREERYDAFEGEPRNIGGNAHRTHHSSSETKKRDSHLDMDPRDEERLRTGTTTSSTRTSSH